MENAFAVVAIIELINARDTPVPPSPTNFTPTLAGKATIHLNASGHSTPRTQKTSLPLLSFGSVGGRTELSWEWRPVVCGH
jgi:hypothetical protein